MKRIEDNKDAILKFFNITGSKQLLSHLLRPGKSLDFSIDLSIRMLEDNISTPAVIRLASRLGEKTNYHEIRADVKKLFLDLHIAEPVGGDLCRLHIISEIESNIVGDFDNFDCLMKLSELENLNECKTEELVKDFADFYTNLWSDDPEIVEEAEHSLAALKAHVCSIWKIQAVYNAQSDLFDIYVRDAIRE